VVIACLFLALVAALLLTAELTGPGVVIG